MKKSILILMLIISGSAFAFSQTITKENFQLQIFKGTVQQARIENSSFLEKHPTIKTYIYWDSPFAYLCIGECAKKEYAIKLQELLLIEYPNAIIRKCD